MKLTYFGHSCFSMTFANGTVLVTDPFDSHITYPPCDISCDIAVLSHHHGDHEYIDTLRGDPAVIDTVGIRELGGIKVESVHSWHDHHGGAHRGNNMISRVSGDGLSIAHMGDFGQVPDQAQLDFLKGLDVLLIPVGGNYTIDHTEASRLIDLVQPRVAVAMHYRTAANADFRADTVEPFVLDTGALPMPRTIEITRENLASIPPHVYLAYE